MTTELIIISTLGLIAIVLASGLGVLIGRLIDKLERRNEQY